MTFPFLLHETMIGEIVEQQWTWLGKYQKCFFIRAELNDLYYPMFSCSIFTIVFFLSLQVDVIMAVPVINYVMSFTTECTNVRVHMAINWTVMAIVVKVSTFNSIWVGFPSLTSILNNYKHDREWWPSVQLFSNIVRQHTWAQKINAFTRS